MPDWDWPLEKDVNAFLIHVVSEYGNEKGGQQRESECRFRIWNELVKMDGIPAGASATPLMV